MVNWGKITDIENQFSGISFIQDLNCRLKESTSEPHPTNTSCNRSQYNEVIWPPAWAHGRLA